MTYFLIAGVVICMTVMGCGFWVLDRNNRVYEFRTMLLNLIDDALKKDLHNPSVSPENFAVLVDLRYAVFNSISYTEMVFSFKKLDVFKWFPDHQLWAFIPFKHGYTIGGLNDN